MNDHLLELAEQSAKNDLAYLIKAKEEAKKRMKDDPSPENIRAFERAKGAVADEAGRLRPEDRAVRVYKTQLDAVAFLKGSGFKIAKSKFNKDFKAGKIPRNADGHFEEGVLLAYAAANLSPVATVENKAAGEAMVNRMSADAELKKFQAERQKLKLEKELGKLMFRSEVERGLAARAGFFRAQIENFGHLMGGRIIALVDGDEAKLPEFLRFWEESTVDWMDAWSADREFVNGDGEEAD